MQKPMPSRRQFIGVASALACGTALSGSIPAMADESRGTSAEPYYEVYETDLLILGCGMAATLAAQRAIEEGRQVMMVDKGPFRHSGASGMSWDSLLIWYDGVADPRPGGELVDQRISQRAYAYLGGNDYYPLVESANHGQLFPYRNEEGDYVFNNAPKMTYSSFLRRELDDIYERGAYVMDETMITRVFINNGRCLGAMGIHVPTGTMRVIRSNATIVATNCCPQFHGWISVGYQGVNSADNTGDVDMSLFRDGLTIGEAEFSQYDYFSIDPITIGVAIGVSASVDGGDPDCFYDANGEHLFEPGVELAGKNLSVVGRIARTVYEEGKGSPNNGVYAYFGEYKARYNFMRNLPKLREFGVDPEKNFVEIVPDMFEHGGTPVINECMMTEIEGLFHTRGAGTTGESGGALCKHNRLYAGYTAHCASEYLRTSSPVKNDLVDWTPVVEEYNRLNEIRTRRAEEGLRPFEIRRKIQRAGYRGFDIYRSTAMMEEALAEIQRIRQEDMPRQTLADDTVNFNTEWKAGIENYNILDSAEVSIKASLLREETRGGFIRPEFPEKDDVNWHCMLTCRYDNGEMSFAKRDIGAYDGQ